MFGGKVLSTEALRHLRLIHHRVCCYKHQLHLGSKGGMELSDQMLDEMGLPYKYFSTLVAVG